MKEPTHDPSLEQISGIIPGVPFIPPMGVSVAEQPMWLVGTEEAAIENFCVQRGWSWHVCHVQKASNIVVLWRYGKEELDEAALQFCLADYKALCEAMRN